MFWYCILAVQQTFLTNGPNHALGWRTVERCCPNLCGGGSGDAQFERISRALENQRNNGWNNATKLTILNSSFRYGVPSISYLKLHSMTVWPMLVTSNEHKASCGPFISASPHFIRLDLALFGSSVIRLE